MTTQYLKQALLKGKFQKVKKRSPTSYRWKELVPGDMSAFLCLKIGLTLRGRNIFSMFFGGDVYFLVKMA